VLANDRHGDLDPSGELTVTATDGAGRWTVPILGFFDGTPQFIGLSVGNPRLLGQVSIAPGGHSVIYTPLQSLNAGETGTDQFKYTINGVTTAVVNITVTGENDAPSAVDDSATIASDGGPLTINVLVNDTDPDTRIDPPVTPISSATPFEELYFDPTPLDIPDTKTVVAVNGSGLQGSVAVAAGGSGVIYTVGGSLPGLTFGQSVVETLTYTIRDSFGAESTAAGSGH
jgi:VCBS repeat-containing protein